MLIVQLHQLIFSGVHGIHAEEKKTTNQFEVDLEVYFEEMNKPYLELEDTVDYCILYQIIRNRMSHPSGLLEQICVELADHIRKEFPFVKEVLISIKKLNPPIENFVGTVGTTLRKRFD